MKAIVAVDKNWGIGKDGQLLVRIPADMRFFQRETIGKVVIMGRKTLESFPGKEPLRDRINIVITRKKDYTKKDVLAVHSIEEALEEAGRYPSDDVYVIGGAQVYRQMLPYCDVVYVTKINYAYAVDAYFPNLDALPEWSIEEESEEQTYYDLEYAFYRYCRKNKRG